ncbi:hypothetical protein CVT25_010760 [Psilocybe cyanescens]|uniref:Uncharacterized protein n=1 Tax=Psilocybe cyanescens TaxID=93625 RepID=A0A409WJS8_PSICY|nr:hypothetical protein CVT25_010760 [Psilocybe cyanescens]
MGTSAVYLVFSGIKDRPVALHRIEVAFYFMNMGLFLLNTLTLLLQAVLYASVYPKRAWRSFTDPVGGVFPPLITGFLEGHQANSAFIVCGPPGFTALALINLGKEAQFLLSRDGLVSTSAGDIWYASSVLCSVLLFGLAVFFFVFGALPYGFKVYKRLGLKDILSCWAVTFPNVGWIATLRLLGDIFDISGFHTLHKVLAIAMLVVWTVLFILTITAFVTGRIFISTEQDVIRDSERKSRRRSSQRQNSRLNMRESPNNNVV